MQVFSVGTLSSSSRSSRFAAMLDGDRERLGSEEKREEGEGGGPRRKRLPVKAMKTRNTP